MASAAMDSTMWYEAFVNAANCFAVNVNAFESRGYDSRYKVETWLRVSGEAGNMC